MDRGDFGNGTFGGAGKGHGTNSPWPQGGHKSYSTLGANDNARTSIDAGGDNISAIVATYLQLYIASRQLDIAQDYYKVNLRDYNFGINTYGGVTASGSNPQTIPGPMVNHKVQAFATPFYAVDYPVYIGGSLARTKVYDDKWFQTRRRMHRYAIGHQRHVDYQFYMARYRGAFSGLLMGRRVEDARKDKKDDQIQSHKVQALNFGITAGNIARQGLASSVGASTHAFDELGSRVGGLANGLGRLAGHQWGDRTGTAELNDASERGDSLSMGRGNV